MSVTAKFKYLPFLKSTAVFTNKCLGCSLEDEFYGGKFREDANKITCNRKSVQLPTSVDKAAHDKIKDIINPFFENNTLETREFLVVRNGKVLYEQYAPGWYHCLVLFIFIDHFLGYTQDTPLIGWSMTKSILNTLIGLRVKDNKLSLDDKASKFIPQWKNDDVCFYSLQLNDIDLILNNRGKTLPSMIY